MPPNAGTPAESASRPTSRSVSDARLRAAKPSAKAYKIACGGGLYLEVTPSGSKLWRWKYRFSGRENRFALGAYPQLLLRDAREQCELARKLVAQGIHPSHQKRSDRIKAGHERANTFQLIAEEWLASKDWEEVTKSRRRQMLKRLVYPHIGRFAASRVTPVQVLDILRRVNTENGPTVAVEARRTMSGVFEFAIATLRAESDPVYPVRKALPPNKTQHKRALAPSETGDLLRTVAERGGQFQTQSAFRLMWLTLARPSEVIEAEWSEFNLEERVWRIPEARTKKRKPHLVPLPSQAVQILESMRTLTGGRTHVFPNRDDRRRPMVAASFRQMLKAAGWAGRYSPHATRTTGSTRLNELGYSSDWIERQLAHEDPNAVRRTYNHADHLAERRVMMQHWADLLDQWAAADGVDAAKKAVGTPRTTGSPSIPLLS